MDDVDDGRKLRICAARPSQPAAAETGVGAVIASGGGLGDNLVVRLTVAPRPVRRSAAVAPHAEAPQAFDDS